MSDLRPVLLMTRPHAASLRFAQTLPGTFRILHAPVLETVPRRDVVIPPADGVIFTSSAGVGAAQSLNMASDLPAFCVGPATTLAAHEAGWSAQQVGEDAETLISALAALAPRGRILHLRGAVARGDVVARLAQNGVDAGDLVIYDQPEQSLTEAARAALSKETVFAPLFSPRSAALLAQQAGTPRDLHLFALSPAVAGAAVAMPHSSLHVCSAPNADEMRKLILDQAGKRLRH